MLDFNDAYNLARANEYKFTLPTKINELNIIWTINNNEEIIATLWFNENATLKLINETPLEIIALFKTKIDAKTIAEFKEYYNSLSKNLLEINIEQYGFSENSIEQDEDFDLGVDDNS